MNKAQGYNLRFFYVFICLPSERFEKIRTVYRKFRIVFFC